MEPSASPLHGPLGGLTGAVLLSRKGLGGEWLVGS